MSKTSGRQQTAITGIPDLPDIILCGHSLSEHDVSALQHGELAAQFLHSIADCPLVPQLSDAGRVASLAPQTKEVH